MLARTEILILSGEPEAVQLAVQYAEKGRRVMLAVPETYLGGRLFAGYICRITPDLEEVFPGLPEKVKKNGFLLPDRMKCYLEALCQSKGIGILYGLRPIPGTEPDGNEEGIRILLAGKGGVFQILCETVYRQEPDHSALGYYTVLVQGMREKKGILWKDSQGTLLSDGTAGYLTVETQQTTNPAKDLASAWRQAQRVFLEVREKYPELELGRFAERIVYEKEFTLQKGRIRPWIKGEKENIPGRTDAVIQSTGGAEPNGLLKMKLSVKQENREVVVVGGGTAGAMAALYAARNKARTVLVEPLSVLGGTATAGGVSTYWFGNRFSDVREIDQAIKELEDQLQVARKAGIWEETDDFHPGVRAQILTELCLEAGVEIRFGELCFGAVMDEEGRKCRGIVTAGEKGTTVYYGTCIIDATGDGDAAVFAGADAVYGSDRDCLTYWASLAQYTDCRTYKNNFSFMTMANDPKDYTRFLMLARRQGGEVFDHGTYLSTRESRHIRGNYTVTLKDLMAFRTYPDALYTCYSNYDPKGKLDADVVYCGVLPPQARIQIPLSALTPCDRKGNRIEGMYVAGKAISATHNVFPSIRMQPDLMHQGAVLGGLLARCLKEKCFPEELTDAKREEILRSLTDDPLEKTKRGTDLKTEVGKIGLSSRRQWVDVEFTYTEQENNEILSVVTAKDEALLFLKERIRKETASYDWKKEGESPKETLRVLLIELCVWHGDLEYLDELKAFVLDELSFGSLPKREGSVMCAQLLPDHGVMPETVYRINLLGQSGSDRIFPVYERLLELLEKQQRDYVTIRKGIYHYVESFAYAAKRSKDRRWIPLLERVLAFEEFREKKKEQEQQELLAERWMILEFILLRALAGLGSEKGQEGLTRLAKGPRKPLALSAAMALEETDSAKNADLKIW